MNYLAHLFLAQPTADSHFGNLLGDFRRGVSTEQLNVPVRQGLENHYIVDRFTDRHDDVKKARMLFKPDYRRFAPVALDMLFDHFLIKHWSQYSNMSFYLFCQQSFGLLQARLDEMPALMRNSVSHMITHNWFEKYAQFDGICQAICAVANRIRFENNFAYCIDDIHQNIDELESIFTDFFPTLQTHVLQHSPELKNHILPE